MNLELEHDSYPSYLLVQLTIQGGDPNLPVSRDLRNDILLDNQANMEMFCDPTKLNNTRKRPQETTVNCQSKTTSTGLIGDYKSLQITVWCNPRRITNVLSLSKLNLLNKTRIEYDRKEDILKAT